ncbi:hypothetical protein Tco_1424113 [Tanacetum coccineum]
MLVEAAHTMLIFAQALLFLRAEAEATALIVKIWELQAKADIGIFIGYAPKNKAYRIYNRRIRKIIETIHVNFDELTAMAFEQLGLGPELQSCVASLVPVEEAPALVESTGSPSSTTVDQDAPSPKIVFEESSSSDAISTTMHSDAPISEYLSKWTKDHPLQNIIGDPSRPISIRL